MLQIGVSNGAPTVQYGGPGVSTLTTISSFEYVPDMYVLAFPTPTTPPAMIEIMLGTAGAKGLAAGITTSSGVVYGFTAAPAAS